MQPARLAGCFLAFCLLISPVPLAAQNSAGSSFYSLSKVALPEGAPIRVEAASNSDLDQRLLDNLIAELRAMGYRVRDDAPLTLYFHSGPTHLSATADPSIGELNASSSRGVEMNLRLWSSHQSGLASGRLSDVGRQRPGYRLQAEIRDGATIYWTFDAVNRNPDADAYTTLDEILPLLVEKIGQTEGTPGPLQ